MTEVVQQSARADASCRSGLEVEPAAHLPRDPVRPERVLEARVVRPGKDEMGKAGLSDPPEPLELRRADERERDPVKRDRAVHGVEDRLVMGGRTSRMRHPGGSKRPGG